MDEPERVDIDEDGWPLEETSTTIPVWMSPQTEFQRLVLQAVGRNQFPMKRQGGYKLRGKIIEIEKAMVSLKAGVISVYPTEFVMEALNWVVRRRLIGSAGLQAFITNCHNEDWRDRFVKEWRKEHPEKDYQNAPKDRDVGDYTRMPSE